MGNINIWPGASESIKIEPIQQEAVDHTSEAQKPAKNKINILANRPWWITFIQEIQNNAWNGAINKINWNLGRVATMWSDGKLVLNKMPWMQKWVDGTFYNSQPNDGFEEGLQYYAQNNVNNPQTGNISRWWGKAHMNWIFKE